MKLITGNLWAPRFNPPVWRCITTNGAVRKDGACVMGRGCALEAKNRYIGFDNLLGQTILRRGNIVHVFPNFGLISFPVKKHWSEPADLALIGQSAVQLRVFALANPGDTFILPRPGCGNGRLGWFDVKPVLEPILPDNVHVITFGPEG
jgi:hypothetical protein